MLTWWTHKLISNQKMQTLSPHTLSQLSNRKYSFCLNFSYSSSISLSISLSFYLCTLREIIYEQWVTTVIYSGINNVLLKDVGTGKNMVFTSF